MSKQVTFVALAVLVLGLYFVWPKNESSQPAFTASASPMGVAENQAGRAGQVKVTDEAMQLAEIRVAPAQLRTVEDRLTVSGALESGGDQIAKITPKVTGKVVRLLVQIGDQVQAGQTLALLESAELAQVQADYGQAVAESRAQDSNLARQQQLARLGQFGRPQLEASRSQALEDERAVHQARHHLEEQQALLRHSAAERDVLGLKVQRNQELKELVSGQDRERTLADLKKAEADLAACQARLRGAQGDLVLAEKRAAITRRALSREEKVYSGHYLTSRELVEAQAAAEMARVRLHSALDRLRLMGGAPSQGDRIALVTPIGGRVQELAVTLGETVPVEKAAFTVVNLDKVWARLGVSAKYGSQVQTGDLVELTSESAPGHSFRGRVSSVLASSDDTTRAVYVLVPLANRQGWLKTGNYVQGTLVTAVRRQKLTVPETALQEHGGRPTLYVSRHHGEFDVRHVVLGAKGKDWREVSDGLNAGEKVATNGTFYLKSEALKSSLSDGCCAGE
ncbi:efflux RND transporter periplasmic adaptor subunit [bacterium]|nr:efflux RND transporter periplasmic adaptor subunit [bacterium]